MTTPETREENSMTETAIEQGAGIRRMCRYLVPIDGQPHFIPLSRSPVAVASAAGPVAVEFWAEQAEGAPGVERAFQVFGTGHPLPGDAQWVGTCARTAEGLVWHLYERPVQ